MAYLLIPLFLAVLVIVGLLFKANRAERQRLLNVYQAALRSGDKAAALRAGRA